MTSLETTGLDENITSQTHLSERGSLNPFWHSGSVQMWARVGLCVT